MDKKIVIVGGGIIGSSTAYYLSKLGHPHVSLIEAVVPGHAASGRAGGFLALDWCDGQATSMLARRSFTLHKELAQELGADTGYRPMKTVSINIAKSREGGKKVKNSPDWIDGDVRDCNVIGTLETTAQVHPRLLTEAFVTRAQDAGVKLVRDEVTGGRVDTAGSVVGLVTRGGGELACDIVILAMGPWTGAGLAWWGLDQAWVGGSRAHSITMQLSTQDRASIDNTALFLSSMKSPEVYPRPDGTVYMCGGCSSDHVPLPRDPSRVEVDEAACDQIKQTAGHLSDAMARASHYTRNACYLPHSTDGVPIIGHVSHVPGLVVAAGHSCWGILQGPATGEAIAELIIHGKASHVDLQPFSPDRFLKRHKKP